MRVLERRLHRETRSYEPLVDCHFVAHAWYLGEYQGSAGCRFDKIRPVHAGELGAVDSSAESAARCMSGHLFELATDIDTVASMKYAIDLMGHTTTSVLRVEV